MEQSSGIYTPFSRQELLPKEERLEVIMGEKQLQIGLPKESHWQEKRICLTPDAVEVLVANGHQIKIEAGAGAGANFTDQEYSDAGAQICYHSKEVYSCHVVLKVEPPSKEEIEMLPQKGILISAIQQNMQTRSYFQELSKKKITALAFEYLKDDHGHFPIIRLISEIAGTTSILIASEVLSTQNGGPGILLGGISGLRPTDVVILGAGTVGEYATRSALGLGCNVRIFDQSLTRLRRLQNNVGQRISTSMLDPKEMQKALMRCDVAIGALRGSERTPVVASEKMVKNMKEGALIIDVSIDNGGCFETSEVTTHEKPFITKHGVIHYGVTNITSRVSRTASKAMSNFFLPHLLSVGRHGGFEEFLKIDAGLRHGAYLYYGCLTKKNLSEWFDLPFNDINLLIV